MRNCHIRTYRHPHTTAERRANQEQWIEGTQYKLCRGKRLPHSLPHMWDYQHTIITKSWKDRRKKQYRSPNRGKKHEIILDYFTYEWHLTEYLLDHNIPYCIEILTHKTPYAYYQTEKRVFVGYEDRIFISNNKTYTIKYPQFQTIELDPPVRYMRYYIPYLGCKITWWSNKDIGVEYILKRVRSI